MENVSSSPNEVVRGASSLSDNERKQADFEAAYGEPFSQTLDLDTWTQGEDLGGIYARIEQEVSVALAQEGERRSRVRNMFFPRLKGAPDAPPNAGKYSVFPAELERIHSGLLFNGQVEACDGTSLVHDTIPLTITQIGVCLVSYNGESGSWTHRLFRRDLRSRGDDPVEEVLTLLKRREKREAVGREDDELSELARRGIMAYAERAILKDRSSALWRMGHGNPAPYELLTGLWSSQLDRIQISLNLIRWYVDHQRFVFVPSAPRQRHLLTIGDALMPMEFVIVRTLKRDIEQLIDTGGYRYHSGVRPAMEEFRDEVAPKIVMGLYRVWKGAPAHIFYAHVDQAEMAARIAMADSLLQEHRGFPMLIDLADTVCRTNYGADSLLPSVQSAYAQAGEPFRYFGEREFRSR
ncbi:MAG TPA: hypothetical protein VJX67_12590 [Blastocatellia bacterium]|nr:hypothetical protein [Blastocatellia bacterium]